MPPTGFEPGIPASERSQTDALDRGGTGIRTSLRWGDSLQRLRFRIQKLLKPEYSYSTHERPKSEHQIVKCQSIRTFSLWSSWLDFRGFQDWDLHLLVMDRILFYCIKPQLQKTVRSNSTTTLRTTRLYSTSSHSYISLTVVHIIQNADTRIFSDIERIIHDGRRCEKFHEMQWDAASL
jgi:hypothetical protein